MLDQQFFAEDTYKPFLNEHFILFHAVRGETEGDQVYDLYEIRATPTVLITDADGNEIDRLVGFGDPETFFANLKKSFQGEDTYARLLARHQENPDDLIVAGKLARKYASMYNEEKTQAAADLYTMILDRPAEAKSLAIDYDEGGEINLFEYAVYGLGTAEMTLARGDRGFEPERLISFCGTFPESRLTKSVYQRLSSYYAYTAPAEKAEPFFAELISKFPDDAAMLYSYVNWVSRSRKDMDKGLEIARHMVDLNNRQVYYHMNAYARLLAAAGDSSALHKEYGEDYITGNITNLGRDISSYASFWLQQEKNLESVLDVLKLAMLMEPENSRYKSLTAQAYLRMNELEKALEVYGAEFLADNIENDRNLYSYALFWAREGKNLEDALFAAERAVQLSETYYYWYTLFQVHQAMDNRKKAVEALEKAVELNPVPSYVQQLEQLKEQDN